jgi:hypothetical protein
MTHLWSLSAKCRFRDSGHKVAGWREASYFLRSGIEDAGDDVGHAIPFIGFGKEAALARGGEPVIFGFSIVFRFTPFAGDPTLVFEAVERRVEGTLLDFETVFGNLLDAKKNTVAMKRAERNGFEDEHIEGALQKFELFVQGTSPRWTRRIALDS